MTVTDVSSDELCGTDVLEAKPCESDMGCSDQATVMVWCDHHRRGCDYTGFRCDKHFQMLYAEAVSQMEKMQDSWLSLCATCFGVVEVGVLSDHLRWVRL